jgi:hypothetical protein
MGVSLSVQQSLFHLLHSVNQLLVQLLEPS